MFDTGFYNQGRGLESGLRAGAAIGGTIKGAMSTNAVQQAAARIQAGEDQATVIQQLMAQDPAAAQQLINLSRGNTQLSSEAQEIEQLKKKYGMENLQSSALPLFGAFVTDDEKSQDKLIEEAAAPFKGQSDGVHEAILEIKKLKGESRINALGGMVKALRQAGVYPDDPSQMMGQGTALSQNLSLYDQAMAAGDADRAELIKRNIDPYSRSFSGGVGAGEARLATEQALNPTLAAREAGKIQATEQTSTGQAKLQQEQQAVAKGEREIAEAARSKENAVAAMNNQLQQIGVLRKHKGFESAVGKSSYIPSIRGGEAFNFERQLEKLNAQSFLAQVPNMVGMGALSNAEGEKINASMSALHVGMSEEEFQRELDSIENVLKQGRERIRTGNLLKPEQQSTQQPASVGRFKIEVE